MGSCASHQERDLKKSLAPITSPVVAINDEDAHIDVDDYHAALAHCTELETERLSLVQMRARVMDAISRLSLDDEDSQSAEDCSDEEEVDVEEAENCADGQPPSCRNPCEAPTLEEYREVLELEGRLEREVEELRETLNVVAGKITTLAQKSHELSDHLEDVGKAAELPTDSGDKSLATNNMDGSTPEISPAARWQIVSKVPLALGKPSMEKLSPLRLASIPGANSGASSSTATPRSSESASESRIVSARSANLCET